MGALAALTQTQLSPSRAEIFFLEFSVLSFSLEVCLLSKPANPGCTGHCFTWLMGNTVSCKCGVSH